MSDDADDLAATVAAGVRMTLLMTLERNSEPGPGACVVWTGATDAAGYGSFRKWGMRLPVHRVAFMLANPFALADDLDVHHDCQNKACVNPEHLRALTRSDHMKWHRAREGKRPTPTKAPRCSASCTTGQRCRLRAKAGGLCGTHAKGAAESRRVAHAETKRAYLDGEPTAES